jgi:hypothetical protein
MLVGWRGFLDLWFADPNPGDIIEFKQFFITANRPTATISPSTLGFPWGYVYPGMSNSQKDAEKRSYGFSVQP